MNGERYVDSTPWQSIAGYSRASRMGQYIAVSGTTADLDSLPPEAVDSTYAQTRNCISRGITAVIELGGSVEGILRTRLFLMPDADLVGALLAHEELLGEVAPANTTLHIHALIGSGLLVEVEIEAVVVAEENL